MKRKLITAAAGLCAALAAATVAVSTTSSAPTPHRPSLIVADGEDLLPSNTATDWVTYSDHLVQVTITAERELTPTADEAAAGEGYLPREVDVNVDQVLWSRSGATVAPATMKWDLDGWAFHGTNKTPIRLNGEPSMNVGETYVVPITHLSQTDVVSAAGWAPLSTNAILPYSNGTIGQGATVVGYTGPESDASGETTAKDDAWGGSANGLVSTMSSTSPNPLAAGYMALPPDERFRHVMSSNATTG
jgi:hypothetical protein